MNTTTNMDTNSNTNTNLNTAPTASVPRESAPPLTWDSLHEAIVDALHHLDRGAPLYLAADVLTDDLFPRLRH